MYWHKTIPVVFLKCRGTALFLQKHVHQFQTKSLSSNNFWQNRMLCVSQCVITLMGLCRCNSAANRQKLGLNFAVPFSHVCLPTMENVSITQLQWCWNYVTLWVRLCLFACYWVHLPKFHSNTKKCPADVVQGWQAFHKDFVVILRCNREVGQ